MKQERKVNVNMQQIINQKYARLPHYHFKKDNKKQPHSHRCHLNKNTKENQQPQNYIPIIQSIISNTQRTYPLLFQLKKQQKQLALNYLHNKQSNKKQLGKIIKKSHEQHELQSPSQLSIKTLNKTENKKKIYRSQSTPKYKVITICNEEMQQISTYHMQSKVLEIYSKYLHLMEQNRIMKNRLQQSQKDNNYLKKSIQLERQLREDKITKIKYESLVKRQQLVNSKLQQLCVYPQLSRIRQTLVKYRNILDEESQQLESLRKLLENNTL